MASQSRLRAARHRGACCVAPLLSPVVTSWRLHQKQRPLFVPRFPARDPGHITGSPGFGRGRVPRGAGALNRVIRWPKNTASTSCVCGSASARRPTLVTFVNETYSDIFIRWTHYRARSFAAIRGAVRCRLRCSGPASPGCACPLHAAAATAAVRTAADIRPAIVRIRSGRRLSLPRRHRGASAERQQEDQRGEPRELDLADIGRQTGAARHSARIASVVRTPKSFGLLHSLR
jgi:hypothetical protein